MKENTTKTAKEVIKRMVTEARHTTSATKIRKIEDKLFRMLDNCTGKTEDDYKMYDMIYDAIRIVNNALMIQLEENYFEMMN
jgi:hypothetical protein